MGRGNVWENVIGYRINHWEKICGQREMYGGNEFSMRYSFDQWGKQNVWGKNNFVGISLTSRGRIVDEGQMHRVQVSSSKCTLTSVEGMWAGVKCMGLMYHQGQNVWGNGT